MATNMRTQGQEIVVCDSCPNTVSFYCRRSGLKLCDTCVLSHLKSETEHDVVDFAKKDDGDSRFCELHPKRELCASIKHNSHNLSDMSEKIEEVLKSSDQENDQLQSLRHQLETLSDPTTNQGDVEKKEGIMRRFWGENYVTKLFFLC